MSKVNTATALAAPKMAPPEVLARIAGSRKVRGRSVPQPKGICKVTNSLPKARIDRNSLPKARIESASVADRELLELRKGMISSRRDARFTPAAIRAKRLSIANMTNSAGALFAPSPNGGKDFNVSLLLRILRRKLSRLKVTIRSTLHRVEWAVSGNVPRKAAGVSSIPAMLAWCQRVADAVAWSAASAEGYEPGAGAELAQESVRVHNELEYDYLRRADTEEPWIPNFQPEPSVQDLAILDVWREETGEVVEQTSFLDCRDPKGNWADMALYDDSQRSQIQRRSRLLAPNWDAFSAMKWYR